MKYVNYVFDQIFNRDVFGWLDCGNWKSCSCQPSTISTIPRQWTVLRRRQQHSSVRTWDVLLIVPGERRHSHFRLCTNGLVLFHFP